MAVTVTDRRSVWAYGDAASETGDAGAGTWNQGTPTTTAFAEATNCIAFAINIASDSIYFTLTGGTVNLGDTILYVQTQVVATQDSWTGGTHGLLVGNGTDQVNFHYSGNDRRQFSHDTDGPVGFQCFALDTSLFSQKISDSEYTGIAGTPGNLDGTAVSQIGVYFITLSKALGGGVNCYVDIIRYGNHGLRITGGGSGTEGSLYEVTVEDKSTSDLKGHGIIREYTAGIYGCQGPLTFGDSTGTATSYFYDSGVVLAYEDRDIANDKYYFNVEGNSTGTNSFILENATVTTAGPYVSCDFASGNIDTLTLDTVVFTGLGNPLTFSGGTDATGHTVNGCTFEGCGQVDPGLVTFTGNTVSGTTDATSGAVLLDASGSANWSNLTVVAGVGATEHGIYINTDGTYDFASIVGVGYDATNGGDKAFIYNNSGGAVVINADSGCDGLTYLNGTSATTTINNSVTLTVTVKDAATLANIQDARVYMTADSGATLLFNELTNASGVVTTSYNFTSTKPVAGVVRKGTASPLYKEGTIASTITSAGLDITILLVKDE